MLKKRFGHFFDKIRVIMIKNGNRVSSKNSGNIWQMWGIPLFGRGEGEVLNLIKARLNQNESIPSTLKLRRPMWIATVNPEFVMVALKDADFKALLNKTSLNVVDGIGLVWNRNYQLRITNYQLKSRNRANILIRLGIAFKMGVEILMGKHRHQVVAGADLMDKMCAVAESMNKSVYFYGGWDNRAEKTAIFFKNKYPKLIVRGYKAENYDFSTKTDILFVARGMRKQEEWIDLNMSKLKTSVVMGVGRSFDYYSGDLMRAPKWVSRMGLEWLYSLLIEPKRFRRQLALPRFIWKVVVGM